MAPNPMMPDPPQWGEGFCRSTIFDWYTDGTLAPEAEWGTLINQSLCDATNRMGKACTAASTCTAQHCYVPLTAAAAVFTVPGTMIRNTMLDKDATCVPPSAQYIRSYYSIGYPLPGYNGTSQWTEQFAAVRTGFSRGMLLALNGAQNQNSATGAGARYYVSSPSGTKMLSIMWSSRTAQGWMAVMMGDAILSMASFVYILLFVWCVSSTTHHQHQHHTFSSSTFSHHRLSLLAHSTGSTLALAP